MYEEITNKMVTMLHQTHLGILFERLGHQALYTIPQYWSKYKKDTDTDYVTCKTNVIYYKVKKGLICMYTYL